MNKINIMDQYELINTSNVDSNHMNDMLSVLFTTLIISGYSINPWSSAHVREGVGGHVTVDCYDDERYLKFSFKIREDFEIIQLNLGFKPVNPPLGIFEWINYEPDDFDEFIKTGLSKI